MHKRAKTKNDVILSPAPCLEVWSWPVRFMSAAMFFRIHQKDRAAQEHTTRPNPALTLTEPF